MQIVETICTICQSLFPGKNKKLEDNLHEMLKRKKIINLSAVESAQRVIKVNLKLYIGRVMQKTCFRTYADSEGPGQHHENMSI